MKYSIRKNKIMFLFKKTKTSIKQFNILESEYKYIDDFLITYHLLSDLDRGKIDLLGKKYTVYRCWYYSKVWYYTRLHKIQIPPNKECLDHIVPISKGIKNNISPELIGSLENIQCLTHKENLAKGINLTDKGKELINLFTK